MEGETLAAFALAEQEYLDHLLLLPDDGLLRTELLVDLIADPPGLCFSLFSCGALPWGLVGRGGGDDCQRVCSVEVEHHGSAGASHGERKVGAVGEAHE